MVLFDSWYLAEEFIACLRRRKKDWISILKKNRKLETNSFVLKDADGKEHLGFDEYRMRNTKAVQKHWYLVFVAYSLLHLDCLPAPLKQIRLPIKTIGEACRQQAQSLIEALILYASQQLEQGQKANGLFAYLFAKHQAFARA